MVDKYGMGETIYRDKDGRKIDPTATDVDGTSREEAEIRLNQGRVQQEARVAMAEDMAILRGSTFARHQDDDRLEAMRKNEIRKGDPMAQYEVRKQQQKDLRKKNGSAGTSQQQQIKPTYKGPSPKANRFGIRPGYRWDGVDRSNGFEDKILAKKFSTNRKAEQSYRWSSADM